MKLLKLFKDCFEVLPDDADLQAWLRAKSKKMGSEDFFNRFIQFVGQRGYNEFLDYGLFALKLNAIFGNEVVEDKFIQDGYLAKSMTDSLLHDDRHDLYQNLPYDIQRSQLENKWDLVVAALIESFNENGTGDVAFGIKRLNRLAI